MTVIKSTDTFVGPLLLRIFWQLNIYISSDLCHVCLRDYTLIHLFTFNTDNYGQLTRVNSVLDCPNCNTFLTRWASPTAVTEIYQEMRHQQRRCHLIFCQYRSTLSVHYKGKNTPFSCLALSVTGHDRPSVHDMHACVSFFLDNMLRKNNAPTAFIVCKISLHPALHSLY